MSYPKIETPRGSIEVNANGYAELKWNTNFKPKWQKRYTEAQVYVDNAVLKYCEPYVPLRTSMLIKSGILGTELGSGEVKYIAPYAKAQYYSARKAGSQKGPLRGPYWFQRMKATHLSRILDGARIRAGGEHL